ncbi:transglycosylase SLT domain-containing protein [Bdellovibrionota bacterium FG-1]
MARRKNGTGRVPKKKKPHQGPPHPWRLCPIGQHYRKAHSQRPYTRRDGTLVSGSHHRATCADNPSGLDQIYSEELTIIAERYFSTLSGLPKADSLGFERGNDFDPYIRGWTRYWNEVLGEKDPLDPDLVKALIATESRFNPTAMPPGKNPRRARGLMQITSKTREILSDESGELKNSLVNVDDKELDDPNLNIAAGIRWLFRKKEIARSKLGKSASWRDAVAEFKDYDDDPQNAQMLKFDELYRRMKK